MPKVSIIIPCYNAAHVLGDLLDSLKKQTLSENIFEVIIVDDGSGDQTRLLVDKYSFVYVYQSNKGAGAARNFGAQRAKGEIILFIDSDCVAPNTWVKKHLEIHQKNKDIGIIGGGVKKPKERTYLSWVDFLSSWFNAHEDLPKHEVEEYLPSLNLSVKSEVFKKIGGFWEKKMTGEDVDFCFRARKEGIRILFDPKLAVWHQAPTFKGFLRHNFNWGTHASSVRGEEKSLDFHLLFRGGFFMSLILFLPISLGYTLFLGFLWWPYQPFRFLWCLPMIFLGKLAYGGGSVIGSWHKSFKIK